MSRLRTLRSSGSQRPTGHHLPSWNLVRVSEDRVLEIGDLLQSLASEGRVDSTGGFSLDPKKALEKLQERRFENPFFYVLKLVQSAVSGGARRVDIEANSQAVKLRYDGCGLEADSMMELFGFLLDETGRREIRHLKHLAAGVHGSLAVSPRRLEVESWDGEQGFRHKWSAGGWRNETFSSKGEPAIAFHLSRQVGQVLAGWRSIANSDIWDLLQRNRSTMEREQAVVFDRCVYAPVSLSLNGRPLEAAGFGQPRFPGYEIHEDANPRESRAPWFVQVRNREAYVEGAVHCSHHLIETYLPVEDGSLASLARPAQSHATVCLDQVGGSGQRCRAWLALESALRPRSRITYVEDGVLINQLSPELNCPGVVGVISCEHLTKDVSGFKLVENQAFEEHLELLRAEAQKLRQALLENLHRVPISDYVRQRLQ